MAAPFYDFIYPTNSTTLKTSDDDSIIGSFIDGIVQEMSASERAVLDSFLDLVKQEQQLVIELDSLVGDDDIVDQINRVYALREAWFTSNELSLMCWVVLYLSNVVISGEMNQEVMMLIPDEIFDAWVVSAPVV